MLHQQLFIVSKMAEQGSKYTIDLVLRIKT